MLRQHQARLRFRPSRWAILPSLRSLTIAGVNKVAGSRLATRGRNCSNQLGKASGCDPRHAQRFGQRGRQEFVAAGLPGLAVAVVAEPVPRAVADQFGKRGIERSAHSSDRISAKAVLKWVPTRIG